MVPWDAVIILDSEGVAINVSSSIEKILPLKKEDILGRKPQELVDRGIIKFSSEPIHIDRKVYMGCLQNNVSGKVVEAFVYGMGRLDKEGNQRFVELIFWDMTNTNHMGEEFNSYKMFFSQFYLKLKRQKKINKKIVYNSNKMKKVIDLAYKVSQVDCNILLEGESGVGKEVISSFIHEMSPRSKQPFVSINCAAIPEQLLEAELFGYEAGTFTGANKNGKMGLIESAHNGTVFLDEINSCPLSLQAKLLRVIETKEIRPLGSTIDKKVNFRMIAASNKSLEKLVEKKLFRKDLFFRLNVIPINIPPLRERKEDVIPLSLKFLQDFNSKYGTNKKISAKAFEYLKNYQWDGNIRELKNVIERLVILAPDLLITSKDLPSKIIWCEKDNNKAINKVDKNYEIIIHDVVPLKNVMNEVEKLLVKKALEKYGSTRPAATALEISQASIVNKINKNKIVKS